MKRQSIAVPVASLAAFRRRQASSLVTVLTYLVFLFTLIPLRPREAQAAPVEPIETAPDTPRGQAPASGVGSPSPSRAGGLGPLGGAVEMPVSTTGSFAYTFVFDLPHARGVEPSLSLHYSSSTKWGIAGTGFEIAGAPFIERMPKPGADYLDQVPGRRNATLEHSRFFMAGGGELVLICKVEHGRCDHALNGERMPVWSEGWSYFRERAETSFNRYFLSPNFETWRVQSKNAARDSELGAALDGSYSAIEYESHRNSPYKWWIVRSYDGTAGARSSSKPTPVNQSLYRYERGPTTIHQSWLQGILARENLAGPLYLSDIYDSSPRETPTLTDLDAFAHHTRLVYETRPDTKPLTIWGLTFGKYDRRLARVDVTSKPFGSASKARELLRRYHLTYLHDGSTSVLRSIRMEGRCDNETPIRETDGRLPEETKCLTLPPTTFGYDDGTEPSPSLLPADKLGELRGLEEIRVKFGDTVIQHVDVNHDGLVDVLVTAPEPFQGSHAVWLNGMKGKAGQFESFPVTIKGFKSDTAETLGLDKPDTLFGDFDGNGKLDMLVATPGDTARLYSLEGDGTSWSWIGRKLPGPLGISLKDKENIRVLDVDGDGTSDIVVTLGSEILTYFSLARLPKGWGLFGTSDDSPDNLAVLLPEPARAPIPLLASGEPLYLARSDVRIADINGDHFPDVVHVAQDGVRFWAGTGAGLFGDVQNRNVPSVLPSGFLALGAEFKTDKATVVRFGDVSGDGLDDLVVVSSGFATVWQNQSGVGFGAPLHVMSAPLADPTTAFFKLADVRGRGRESLVWTVAGKVTVSDWVGAEGLLTRISNGYGATTDIGYSDTINPELARRANGDAPRFMSTFLWLTSSITTSDNLDLVGGTKGTYVRHFSYDGPYLNPVTQRFVGFRSITVTHDGDAARPTEIERVQYHLGECQDHPLTPMFECGPDMAAAGNPRAALAMRPKLVERLDEKGTLLETTHYGYRLRLLYPAHDYDRGWTTHAYAFRSDVQRYGTPNAPSTAVRSLVDVQLDGVATAPPETSDVPVRDRSTSLASEAEIDSFGNTLSTTSLGREGTDAPIRNGTEWAIPSGDATGWVYRPVHTWRTSSTGAILTDATHEMFTQFDAFGRPTVVETALTGTLPLQRSQEPSPSGGAALPPPAPKASQNGRVELARAFYDELGNPTGTVFPNHRCLEVTYDRLYGQLPTGSEQYVGTVGTTPHPVLGACGGTVLRSFASFDRGFERIRQSLGYHGEKAAWEYDVFGRPSRVFKPSPIFDPTHLGDLSRDAAVKFTYDVKPDVPLARTLVETLYVDEAGAKSYRQTWTLRDGFGRSLATIDEADPSAGDDARWIVRNVVGRSARGDITQSYLPWFWDGAPSSALLSSLVPVPMAKASSTTYDAFGRVVDTFAIDGTHTSHREYPDALSYRVADAEDLAPRSLHAGTPTTVRFDGHGRVVSESTTLHEGQATRATETQYAYDHDSNLVQITRVHPDTPDAPVVRTMAYDSLGRMVLNIEPNTSTSTDVGPTRGPVIRAWRYAYNDNGDLVGTSDARGCGKNLYYDAGGRLLAEDYWPCLLAQGAYTEPNLTTGDGTEAFYRYDSLPADLHAVLGGNPALTSGRLTATYDRGSATIVRFDGRGRATGIARKMARPGATATNLSDRYGSHWFLQETAYREDDGIASSTTGAEAADLLANGASTISPRYSKRGAVVGLTSSYGTLVASVKRSAEGLELETVYGDAASTTTTTTYDERLRPKTVETARAKAAGWSAVPSAISPPPTPANGTTQLVLESLAYAYDAVGNPTSIKDARDPAEWPAGAKPASRTFTYDDLYRLTEATTSYAGGSDSWSSPHHAENAGPVDDAKRDHAAPERTFAKRTTRQTFAYDGLGNTTATTDDDAHGFYDRSLGTIKNGSASLGPNRLEEASSESGSLTAAYDASGNVTGIKVHRLACTPSGGACTERYAYEWDEVGRLARARRWDVTSNGETLGADLTYVYDGGGERVLKTSAPPGTEARHTLYVFGSLELRRARWLESQNDYDRTSSTEVPRLGGIGRVVFASADMPLVSGGKQHVLLELAGHLGSTSTVLDKDTGELVEKKTFQPYGAAESDYRPDRWGSFREEVGFTGKEEDIEVGLIYFGHRYLQPYLGRWMSADPLAIHAAGADLNPYAYVGGSVTAATDPDGLAPNSGNHGGPACSEPPCSTKDSPRGGGAGGNSPEAVPEVINAPEECFVPIKGGGGLMQSCDAQAKEDAARGRQLLRENDEHERRASQGQGGPTSEADGKAGGREPGFVDKAILLGRIASLMFELEHNKYAHALDALSDAAAVTSLLSALIPAGAAAGGAGTATGGGLAIAGGGTLGAAATGIGAVVIVGGVVAVAVMQNDRGTKLGSSGGPTAGKRFSPEQVKEAADGNDGHCAYCGVKMTNTPGPNKVNGDHADPSSRGGNTTDENLNSACRTCNLDKGPKTFREWLEGYGLIWPY